MMVSQHVRHPLVVAYRAELERALAPLPDDRRHELLDDLLVHIAEALDEIHAPTDADIRTVLDRVGEPTEIVREAGVDLAPAWQPPPAAPSGTLRETLALLLLTVGSIVASVFGWAAGVVLLWTSDLWTTRDKVIGTLLVPGGWSAFPLLLILAPVETCSGADCGSGSSVGGTIAIALLLLGPIVGAIYLGIRLRTIRRAATRR